MKEPSKTVISWFSFCLRAAAVICLCAVLLMAQTGGIVTKGTAAKETADAALEALGGADKIGGIKSLTIKGTRTVMSTGYSKASPSHEFEIRMLLPDSFVQIYRFPSSIRYIGITPAKLISLPSPPLVISKGSASADLLPDGRISANGAATDKALVKSFESFWKSQWNHLMNNRKDEWSYFLAGTLMKTGPTPLTVSSGSKPGVFALTKKDGVAGEIEFDSATGFPSVIRYKRIDRALFAAWDAFESGGNLGPGTPINITIQFRDRFSIEGIMFPRVISITTGQEMEELNIREVLINPNLSLKDFEPSK